MTRPVFFAPLGTLGLIAILIDAENLGMSRPDRPLFVDVSLTVNTGDRLGIVGINGTGKSTLLRVIAGTAEPESGTIRRGRDLALAVLDQDAALPDGTVRDAVLATGAEKWEAEAALSRLGMGEFFTESTASLSGGEKKRVALATALVRPSNLLILDEPTNHLDIDGIMWLEERLEAYRGGLILVTHDRVVLDRLTTHVLELDRGTSYFHTGGYASYLEAKAERTAAAESAESVRRNLARKELAWLRRGAPARTSKPKYRVEAAKALIGTKPEGPARPADLHLEFPTPRLGDIVIELDQLVGAAPDGRNLFGPFDLKLDPRERLAIRGGNGVGKSTLLNLMAKRIEPVSGSVRWGTTVELAYYTQQSDDAFDPSARAREVVAGPNRKPDWTDARLLEAFWFDTDAQWAQVSTLSGGERRRLHLLTILASKPNVLLLDEPTNDLDLETLRSLEDFLEDWPGALVVVSHDRAFLDRVANRQVTITPDGVVHDAANGEPAGAPAARPAKKPPKPKGDTRQKSGGRSKSTLGHQIRAIEKEMARLSARKEDLEGELSVLAAGTDYQKLADVGVEHAEVVGRLDEIELQWLELSEQRDSL
ncbi:MAG: ABC-F family ATP-binding cassette domain-containing protein [Acidimicrobiales bacterium]